MISQSDLIMVGLAFLIGYLDDIYGPQPYHYKNQIVIVDKKYILLANSNFDLTDEILKILDKELKSINLN